LELVAHNGQVLLQVGYFITSRPELLLVFCLKAEDNIFCLALFVKPKLLLIAICSRLLQRPAPLVAILLLCAAKLRFDTFASIKFRTCLIEEQKLDVAVHVQKLNSIPSARNTRFDKTSHLLNRRKKAGRGCTCTKAK
jgi:hypothetical protein